MDLRHMFAKVSAVAMAALLMAAQGSYAQIDSQAGSQLSAEQQADRARQLERAHASYESGRSAVALRQVQALLAAYPGDAEARFLNGIVFAELNRTDEAIETFAGMTQDFPDLPEPYNNLAVLFAERGEFEKAREALMDAIQTHPSYSTAHENLGDLYARMAGLAYDRALEEDSENESARLKLSGVNGLFPVPQSTAYNYSQPAAPVSQPPTTTPEPVSEPVTQPAPTQVAVAEPPPVTAAPEPVADASGEVRDAVNAWARAWAGQDVERYLRAYVSSYRPENGASHAAWVAYRRDRITKPVVIEVDLSNLQVEMLSAGRARAVFRQDYRSDSYRDAVTKTLILSREGSDWRILSENSAPL